MLCINKNIFVVNSTILWWFSDIRIYTKATTSPSIHLFEIYYYHVSNIVAKMFLIKSITYFTYSWVSVKLLETYYITDEFIMAWLFVHVGETLEWCINIFVFWKVGIQIGKYLHSNIINFGCVHIWNNIKHK